MRCILLLLVSIKKGAPDLFICDLTYYRSFDHLNSYIFINPVTLNSNNFQRSPNSTNLNINHTWFTVMGPKKDRNIRTDHKIYLSLSKLCF